MIREWFGGTMNKEKLKVRRCWLIICCVLLVLTLTSCGENNASKYEKAQVLVIEGKYEEALTAFEELNGYEDSGKYIAYVKCLQLGESGQYELAISSLETLGDFKEAQLFVIYYSARDAEQHQMYEEAELEYKRIATFRDSAERLGKLPDLILDREFTAASNRLNDSWSSSNQADFYNLMQMQYSSEPTKMLDQIYELADTKLTSGSFGDADGLFGLLAEVEYKNAAEMQLETRYQFAVDELDGEYRNYALMLLDKLAENGYPKAVDKNNELDYEAAKALLDAGDYLSAAAAFDKIITYADSQTQAQEALYQEAVRLYSQGKASYQKAYEMFVMVSGYKDADGYVKSFEDSYATANAYLESAQYDLAISAFADLGTYGNSADMQKEASYRKASACLEEQKYDDAYAIFVQLGDYSDAVIMKNEVRYQKALAHLNAAEYDAAIAIFRELDAYKDAKTMVNESKYQKAAGLGAQGLDEEAMDIFASLSDYKDSASRLTQIRGEQEFDAGNYAKAWEYFSTLDGTYHTRSEQFKGLYEAAAAAREAGEYKAAIGQFELLGGYSDAAEQVTAAKYLLAASCVDNGDYDQAIALYQEVNDAAMLNNAIYHKAESLLAAGNCIEASKTWLGISDYQDSRERNYLMAKSLYAAQDYDMALTVFAADIGYMDSKNQIYQIADDAFAALQFETAIAAYTCLGSYKDCENKLNMAMYAYAENCLQDKQYNRSVELFMELGDFSDANERVREVMYAAAEDDFTQGNYIEAAAGFESLGDYSDSVSQMNESLYRHANGLAAQGYYEEAQAQFIALEGYSDSSDRAIECQYQNGLKHMNNGEYTQAVEVFLALDDYLNSKDCMTQSLYCLAASEQENGDPLRAVEIFQGISEYSDSAARLKESYILLAERYVGEAKYEQAYLCYKAAGNYPGAAEQAEKTAYTCATMYSDAEDYLVAAKWFSAAGNYSDALEKLLGIAQYYFTTRQYEQVETVLDLCTDATLGAQLLYDSATAAEKAGDYVTAARLYQKANGYSNAELKYHAMTYNMACETMGEGEKQTAYDLFDSIRDYEDSAQLANELAVQLAFQPCNQMRLGSYQQDADQEGAKEPIEWIVVAVRDGKAMLMSKYGLDAVSYADAANTTPSWNTSNVRAWLNDEFLNEAFSEEEQAMLCTSEETGNDKVLLLSAHDAALLESIGISLECSPTLAAVLNGANVRNDKSCEWLLMDVDESGNAPMVVSDNRLVTTGDKCDASMVVRPVVWVDLQNEHIAELMGSTQILAGMVYGRDIKPDIEQMKEYQEAARHVKFEENIVRYKSDEKFDYGVVFDASVGGCEITFSLPEDCKTWSARLMGVSFTDGGKRFWIEFYADGNMIQAYSDVTEKDDVHVTLDVRNCKTLTIKAGNRGSYNCGFLAMTDIIYRVGVLPSVCEQNPYLPDLTSEELVNQESIEAYLSSLQQNYQSALALIDSAQYESAFVLLDEAPDYAQSECYILECRYQRALDQLAIGRYEDAYGLLSELLGYKDVNEIIMTNEHLIEMAKSNLNPGIVKSSDCVVGQYVMLGHFEQDNRNENNKEPIEWLVLAVDEKSAVLISRYVLFGHDYSADGNRTTWEKSTLRSWLNDTFYKEAFSGAERAQILLSAVTADKHPNDEHLDVGADTNDYVYLLSYQEAQTYFQSNDERKCSATAYAFANGVYNEKDICYWYLRTPSGSSGRPTSDVHCDGKLGNEGRYYYYDKGGVRPVIRINTVDDPIGKMLVEAGILEY